MSHRDTDQPRVDRDLLDQLVRERGLTTPDYINDAERQDREAAREWLNESVFDWTLPEHEIQLASEGSGGGGHWDGSMPPLSPLGGTEARRHQPILGLDTAPRPLRLMVCACLDRPWSLLPAEPRVRPLVGHFRLAPKGT